MSSYLCPGQRNPGQGIKGKLNTAVSLQTVPYETIIKTIFQFIVKRTCKTWFRHRYLYTDMQSVLWENDSQSCLKLGLTQNIAIQIAVKKVNIIFIASEFQFFLQTNFVIFEVKIRFDQIFFLTYDNLKVLFKSDVNYLFWLLWNTKWKLEMIGMTQNWFCTVLFQRRWIYNAWHPVISIATIICYIILHILFWIIDITFQYRKRTFT